MPGRTRRVRLLAVVVCIVTVFFLYERNAASVDEYADAWTRNSVVGGGAVLRNDKHEQEPLHYAPEDEPKYQPSPEPRPVRTTTTSRSPVAAVETTKRAKQEEDIALPTKTPDPGAPHFYGDGDNNDDRLGSSEHDLAAADDDDDTDDFHYTPVETTIPVPHWTKLSEKFPVTSTIQLPTAPPSPIPRIQKQGPGKGKADKERLAEIRKACKHAWNGFRTQGWGFDEVRPVSGGGVDSFNGWGATLVDSLDTLWIMGLEDEFKEAVNKTAQIDFTTSSRHDIPLFEVTIRYLGGMLGAYDVSGRTHHVLLDKAVELAELLYSAFDTPNRIPETYYEWKSAFASNTHRASIRAVMAEIGTLSLEFTRLAQLTGEPKYYDAIARITDEFEKWQNNTRLPGMWPTDLDASGCKKPVRKAATPTNPQSHHTHKVPLPGSDSSYMFTSDPVQIDQDTLSKAEHAVDELTQKDGSSKKIGSVANPSMGHVASGSAAAYSSNLRHSMNDDPWVKQESPIRDDTTNHATANEPLPPGAGSSEGGVRIENPSVGNRPSDPLLPNAGGNTHQKRQLDNLDIATNDTLPAAAVDDDIFHQVLKKQDIYDPVVEEEEEEPEDECEYQGFASCSSFGSETFTLGGKSDSTFEYLPKEYLLLGGRLEQYKTMYLDSMKPVVDKLIFRPMTKENADILVSGEVVVGVNFTTKEFTYSHAGKLEHLTCFAGGMFAMGGILFNNPDHVEIGRKLTDGCVWAYNSTASGIMPDGATLLACEDQKDCKWNQTAWWESLDYQDAESRQEQIDEWKKTYEVDDIAAWRKQKAADEAAESSSSAAAAAAMATETATHSPYTASDEYEQPLTVPETRPDIHHMAKRQLDDGTEPVAPQPQPALGPSPTRSSVTIVDADQDEGETDILGDHTSLDRSDVDGSYSIPSPAAPSRPAFTPDPPLTHEEFVLSKIEDNRIPPGYTNVGGNAYILRPEAIESVFYMYRITGEQYWRDVGWKMFLAVEGKTRTEYGHSSLDDVTKKIPYHTDKMESFWIAETLKYFYLLFDDPDTWSLDDWVLNTEAHFFQRPKA